MLLVALAVQKNTTNNHIVNMFRTLQKDTRITEKQLKLLFRTYSWYLEKNARLQPFANSLCSQNFNSTYLEKDAYHEMPFGLQFMSTDEKLCVLNSYALVILQQ